MKRIAVLCAAVAMLTVSLGAADQTWVGEISDSACEMQHESGTENVPPPPAKECVANCVHGGSKYVLVVENKVLQVANQNLPALADLAGSKVKITGTLAGNTVTVTKLEKAE
ncbi:MAG: hypothetical protein LBQ09_12245 [Acidobacteriaceae bacterium]|nr:hypothetical protein [Acidobacteriaceae bacterium]